jgi:hypothetical protein
LNIAFGSGGLFSCTSCPASSGIGSRPSAFSYLSLSSSKFSPGLPPLMACVIKLVKLIKLMVDNCSVAQSCWRTISIFMPCVSSIIYGLINISAIGMLLNKLKFKILAWKIV